MYDVEAPVFPKDDLSGDVGPRLLRLLHAQARHNLEQAYADREAAGIVEEGVFAPTDPAGYTNYFLAGSAIAFSVLTRFGALEAVEADELQRASIGMIRTVVGTHRLSGAAEEWSKFASGRELYLLGMAAWLWWEHLEGETQALIAGIIEYEADRFLGEPAPAQLYDDTQAESNAWTGGGIAIAACMLRSHPRRDQWQEKANEYMISAYATAADMRSEHIVDGRPLREWLTGPNALPDFTVENHGFVHADYMAAISEMVRSAIAYRLAGLPVPEAATFNAEPVLDRLVAMMLPDGTHLYPQGTDYTPRRIDSFFQACNLIPLRPDPLRKACFLRALSVIETMLERRPEMPMTGWLGCRYDLGTTWGLHQNYLIWRLFGDGGEALEDARIEQALSGVHISDDGMFAVQRTARTLTSVSWHHRTDPPRVMGFTMPLDRDVICYPMPLSPIGQVREVGDGDGAEPAAPRVLESHICQADGGFGVMMRLDWCSGKVEQDCAWIALPDGESVYVERRMALADVDISRAISGNVVLIDDPYWVFQDERRTYRGAPGALDPVQGASHKTSWLNVDDRMGYVARGSDMLRLYHVPGVPAIFRRRNTMYDTTRFEFMHGTDCSDTHYHAGECMSSFALLFLPNTTAEETVALSEGIGLSGCTVECAHCLALRFGERLVYANFGDEAHRHGADGRSFVLDARACGWVEPEGSLS